MESSDASRVAANASRGFPVCQCQECAENIKKHLCAAGHHGQLVELRTRGGRDFMICLSYDGGQATITQTGRHTAVRVGDTVFDNLHPDGMEFDPWLKDFDAVGGVAIEVGSDF